MTPYASIKELADFYMGLKDKTVKVDKLEEMEEADRKKLFELACAQAGVEIDPELFTNSN